MRNEFEPSGILHSEAKTSAKNNVVNFVTSMCTTLQKWATKLSRSWQSYVRNAALLYLILSTRRRVRNWPTANWLATTTLDPVHMYMWTFYGDPRGLHTSCTVQAARQNSRTAFPASGDQKKVGKLPERNWHVHIHDEKGYVPNLNLWFNGRGKGQKRVVTEFWRKTFSGLCKTRDCPRGWVFVKRSLWYIGLD